MQDAGTLAENFDSGEETIASSVLPSTPRKTPSAPPATFRTQRDSSPERPLNPLITSDPISGGRFAPGQIVSERYRIVALAGRGGMGEVYRAEDLRLGQVVAIKFLPESLSSDAAALARFHSEVRIARQISHANVCRVFDIGDANGVPFLSMEYVDGEDLASVVRRIGRLSPDKATEIARQICAGMAAAHERGVIHRDMKPANVMLDGAGKIRITDFGLAGIAANMQGAEVRAGTPAYMAPEQLSGKEVTVKSDIYSLGLILYEVLTGKRAFDAKTLPELMKLREEGAITNPSTLVRDLDPLIERVILRCLENDPQKRPASALQVAAALPGGDPLAAALAAGETPSPQMVAAAGETSGLAPRFAVMCLVAALLGMAAVVFFGIKESALERMHPENPPEVLAKKAREIISTLGYAAPPVDNADGFSYDDDFLTYLLKIKSSAADWNRSLSQRPTLLAYWYRQSPREMSPNGFWNASLTPGVVTFDDPPPVISGMIQLRLDHEGRLTYFQAMPPEMEESPQTVRSLDWSPLFKAAGLDSASLQPAEPLWNSLASSDVRSAWNGTWPGSGLPLHVEAAAWRGKPVFFSLMGSWTKPSRMNQAEQTRANRVRQIVGLTVAFIILCGGVFLAYRNYVRGKGDRIGALRLATAVFVLEMLIFLVRAHFVFTLDTIGLFAFAVSTGLFISGIIWILYLALEPYVRKNWPQMIISWSRLLAGKFRDPLIGRDVLFGVLLGAAWTLVFMIGAFFAIRAGTRPELPNTDYLEGARQSAAVLLLSLVGSVQSTLVFFLILVFLRVLFKNRWLAAAIFVLLFAVPRLVGSDHPMIDGPVWVVIYGIAAIAVVRFGLIVLAVGIVMANVLLNVPYTMDFSNWYAARSLCMLLAFVVTAVWGFYTSLAGQRLWKDELFD